MSAATSGAVLDAAETALTTALMYFKHVGAYAGQVETLAREEAVEAPFAGLFIAEESYQHVDGPTFQNDLVIAVVIGFQGFRGQADLMTGSQGARQAIADVKTALINKTFGLAIDKLVPVSVENLIATSTAVAYLLKFRTSFDEAFA